MQAGRHERTKERPTFARVPNGVSSAAVFVTIAGPIPRGSAASMTWQVRQAATGTLGFASEPGTHSQQVSAGRRVPCPCALALTNW